MHRSNPGSGWMTVVLDNHSSAELDLNFIKLLARFLKNTQIITATLKENILNCSQLHYQVQEANFFAG